MNKKNVAVNTLQKRPQICIESNKRGTFGDKKRKIDREREKETEKEKKEKEREKEKKRERKRKREKEIVLG